MREITQTIDTYYNEELEHLRSLAAEFARAHPEGAPSLGGPLDGPGSERLLEGVAFLTALLRRKLDDEFPEFIHGLMEMVFPHYLRPVPSVSIVAFAPKPGFEKTISVPAGTELPPAVVDDTLCSFRTCFDLEVHPLEIRYVGAKAQGSQLAQINMALRLSGMTLREWQPKRLSFMLGGPVHLAADICFLLRKYLDRIILEPADGGSSFVLPAECLKFPGFDPEAAILPYPARSFSGYRLLEEYFLLNSKLLFMDLVGWEAWRNRGDGTEFRVIFEFSRSPLPLSAIAPPQVILSATPVVNLFSTETEPVTLDHCSEKVRLVPRGLGQRDRFRIYSVDKVMGRRVGEPAERAYLPLEWFDQATQGSPLYEVTRSPSPVDDAPEVFLSFPYAVATPEPQIESLSVELTCTNGTLPARLGVGDIRGETTDSSGPLLFRNVVRPTVAMDPPLGRRTLWSLLGHLSLNHLSLADASNLRDMLRLYAFRGRTDHPGAAANLRQIEGIRGVSIEPASRFIRGAFMRGQSIEVVAQGDHFASLGALYLFGSLLNGFFALYSPMHSFTHFRLRESKTGETFTWPERMGARALL